MMLLRTRYPPTLKEWASIVNALKAGDQTVLLRKGGIQEDSSGFMVGDKRSRFFLFPTFEHQEKKHIKPEFHKHLDNALSNKPSDGFNMLDCWARVVYENNIHSEDTINELSRFHILSDSYVKERIEWLPEKPMKVLFLKVYKVPGFEIPILPEYNGCKSWIDLQEWEGQDASNSRLLIESIENNDAVLIHEKLDAKIEEFSDIVGGTPRSGKNGWTDVY